MSITYIYCTYIHTYIYIARIRAYKIRGWKNKQEYAHLTVKHIHTYSTYSKYIHFQRYGEAVVQQNGYESQGMVTHKSVCDGGEVHGGRGGIVHEQNLV